MIFEIMVDVVKGFKKLNNNEFNKEAEEKLNTLIKIAEENGLVEFSDNEEEKVLFYGPYNKEMVTIKVKDDKKGIKKLKINFNSLLKEVTGRGIRAGL
jgi:hypothetical protein